MRDCPAGWKNCRCVGLSRSLTNGGLWSDVARRIRVYRDRNIARAGAAILRDCVRQRVSTLDISRVCPHLHRSSSGRALNRATASDGPIMGDGSTSRGNR